MTAHRITVATGIRFWQESSGAEARIAQIVRHLRRRGDDVEVLFTAGGEAVPERWNDEVRIVRLDHFAAGVGSLRRLGIRAKAALARLGGGQEVPHDWRSTISDVEQAAFADYLSGRAPGILLVEYVWLTRLVTGLPAELRRRLRCFVDTHDVMHLRTEAFATRNRDVFMAVDRDGERAALLNFDLVIAIQHSDAEVLRALCPERPVIVAVHPGQVAALPAPRRNDEVRFLFVGSKSHPNVDSLKGLLSEVWPVLYQRHGKRVRLEVAGNIVDRRGELPEAAGVSYAGIVDDLQAAYAGADVVLAPVLYGTGLKIKVVEALCFGKATVTNPAGVDGMVFADAPPCAVLEDWGAYLQTCERLIAEPAYGRDLEARAFAYARETFSEAAAFAGLDRAIDGDPL